MDSPTPTLPDDLTFEAAMTRLEAIAALLEGDGVSLEESLAVHAEGLALARFCMARLQAAELRIQELALESDE